MVGVLRGPSVREDEVVVDSSGIFCQSTESSQGLQHSSSVR